VTVGESESAAPVPIAIPEQVIAILSTLEAGGYETWCVGGAIRDALAGDPHQDVDLATAAPPDVVQKMFRRTVAVGVEHGTVGVIDAAGVLHEVTTFRRDVRTDGRRAVVEFGVSLEQDLARRDFTINAIAFHPVRNEWRDPFGGRKDFDAGIVRAVGDPAARFREDRLRILRALRFAARFGFAIEPETWAAARAQAADTAHLSAERVRDEWIKGIKSAQSLDALVQRWWDSGVAAVWLPECHPPDAGRTAGSLPILAEDRDPVRATSVFCQPCAPVWRRLKGSNSEIQRAEAIDRGPARPATASPRDVRRWMATVGSALNDLRLLAVWRGDVVDRWPDVVDQVRSRNEATSRGELAVTGDDLIATGVPPGPEVGRTLERLLDAVIDDPSVNERERLLALATFSL
jgi:tRNA nucleotidyltransferase (CCA-adding enzyme)